MKNFKLLFAILIASCSLLKADDINYEAYAEKVADIITEFHMALIKANPKSLDLKHMSEKQKDNCEKAVKKIKKQLLNSKEMKALQKENNEAMALCRKNPKKSEEIYANEGKNVSNFIKNLLINLHKTDANKIMKKYNLNKGQANQVKMCNSNRLCCSVCLGSFLGFTTRLDS